MAKDNKFEIRTPRLNDGDIPVTLEEFVKMGYDVSVVWDSENKEFVVIFTS